MLSKNILKTLFALILCFNSLATSYAASIYRCQDKNNQILFSQTACSTSDAIETIINTTPAQENNNTTSTFKPDSLQKFYLEKKSNGKQNISINTSHNSQPSTQCTSYKNELDKIESLLRTGYKAIQSDQLKEERRLYKKLIRQIC